MNPRLHRSFAQIAVTVSLAIVTQNCSVRYLPPPVAPRRVVPVVVTEALPPREGAGQVTLDAVGERARVERVTGRTQVVGPAPGAPTRARGTLTFAPGTTQLTTRPLCETPCTINLPYGPHELLFSALNPRSLHRSTTYINVGRRPSVARHAMGYEETHPVGTTSAMILLGLSATALLFGPLMLALNDPTDPWDIDLVPTGWAFTGVGVAFLISGVVVQLTSRPVSRPGATTQWTP